MLPKNFDLTPTFLHSKTKLERNLQLFIYHFDLGMKVFVILYLFRRKILVSKQLRIYTTRKILVHSVSHSFHPRGEASRSLYSTILGLLLFLSLGRFSPFKIWSLAWCAFAIIDLLGAKRNIPKGVLTWVPSIYPRRFPPDFSTLAFSAGCIKPALDTRFPFSFAERVNDGTNVPSCSDIFSTTTFCFFRG